jgi:hypothetical protein
MVLMHCEGNKKVLRKIIKFFTESKEEYEPTAAAKKNKRGFQPTTVIVMFFMPAVDNSYVCQRFI